MPRSLRFCYQWLQTAHRRPRARTTASGTPRPTRPRETRGMLHDGRSWTDLPTRACTSSSTGSSSRTTGSPTTICGRLQFPLSRMRLADPPHDPLSLRRAGLLRRAAAAPDAAVDNASADGRSWSIEAAGIEHAAEYIDGFGNRVHLVTHCRPYERAARSSPSGVVETQDTAGVLRHRSASRQPARFSCRADAADAVVAGDRCGLADELGRAARCSTGCTPDGRRSPSASPMIPGATDAVHHRRAKRFEAGQRRLPGPCPYLHRRRPPARHPGPLCHRLSD